MTFLVFAGSLRADSLNKKLSREAVRLLGEAGEKAEFLDLKDYPMPVYDGDLEEAIGIPEAAKALGRKIAEADGLIIATPEYNGGIPGALKNVLDWLSRDKPPPISGKHLLLLAASPGALGGVRGLWHSRQPFEALGVHVYPGMMGLPGAGGAFDEAGRLRDEKTLGQLKTTLQGYVTHLKKGAA